MPDKHAGTRLPAGYMIRKIYVVICDRYNEDITRPQSVEDVTTLAEARQLVRDHDRVWHQGEPVPG